MRASPWNALYDQCLLWNGSTETAAQDEKYKAAMEWQRYDDRAYELREPLSACVCSVQDLEPTKAMPVCTFPIVKRPAHGRIVHSRHSQTHLQPQ